ncbi:hypothetical protein U758_02920 [Streptococcus mitis 27/7]|nr:hypothetical protein U758_02920 [Streptococcus mitis 27/7]
MSHSFKKSLQKEILHRSSIAAFMTSLLLLILLFGFSYFFTKATTLQRHETDCQTSSRDERSK